VQYALAIAVGIALLVGAYFNAKYGERWFMSKRGDLSAEERDHFARADRTRRTQLLAIIGALLLLVGVAAAFPCLSG
jgi:hypothetical protein